MSEVRLIDANALEPDTEWNGYYDEYVSYSQIQIDCAPTVDAVPVVHGHWIEKGQEIYCSVCDEESAYTWAGASRFSHYCPSCGAKMDEVEE